MISRLQYTEFQIVIEYSTSPIPRGVGVRNSDQGLPPGVAEVLQVLLLVSAMWWRG